MNVGKLLFFNWTCNAPMPCINLCVYNKNFSFNLRRLIDMKKTWIILAVLIGLALVSTVSAAEIKFDKACDVSVKYLGGDAGFSNYFGWVSGTPPTGTLNQLGQGHVTPVNSIFSIGARTKYENNILYIKTDENNVFYSDPANENPDGLEHVKVEQIDANGYIVRVGFEDLYNGGDKDFNDIYLQVSCTPIANPPPVPEFPTMALPVALIIGMLGAVLFVQRIKDN